MHTIKFNGIHVFTPKQNLMTHEKLKFCDINFKFGRQIGQIYGFDFIVIL